MSILCLVSSRKGLMKVHCCGGWLHESRLHDLLAAVIEETHSWREAGIAQTAIVDDVHARKGMQGQVLRQ